MQVFFGMKSRGCNLVNLKISHFKESRNQSPDAHVCVMLMVAFLDQPGTLWTFVPGFLLLGLICFMEDKVHTVLLCSATSGRSLLRVELV